jgi:hypothetical protein
MTSRAVRRPSQLPGEPLEAAALEIERPGEQMFAGPQLSGKRKKRERKTRKREKTENENRRRKISRRAAEAQRGRSGNRRTSEQ